MRTRFGLVAGLTVALASRCATAPKPTAGSLKIRANPPAIVEGLVRDSSGQPVSGIGVRGIPLGEDIPWSPTSGTDGDGRFRLVLAAPGGYGFLLFWKGHAVVTPSPRDPARAQISVEPGERREGVELLFLRDEWERATGARLRGPSPP